MTRKQTEYFTISQDAVDAAQIARCAEILSGGGILAFPTETVYGLGANALDGASVAKIFAAKGRPADNPLIVHIAASGALSALAREIPEKARRLAEAFWPGPLTMIVKKSPALPDETTAGLDTVGVRMPAHPVASALIQACGFPVAAPSANRSGKPSPTKARYVRQDMDGRADGIILSEDSGVGVESTVINMTAEPPVILRPGMITKNMIEAVIGPVALSEGITTGEAPERPASPGMKYTHYAPTADVVIVSGTAAEIRQKIAQALRPGEKTAVLTSVNAPEAYRDLPVRVYALGEAPEAQAHALFSALRACDDDGIEKIYAEQFTIGDRSLAAADRLLHAAGYHVI